MAITATPGLEEGAEGELVPAAEARLQLRERDRRRHLRRGGNDNQKINEYRAFCIINTESGIDAGTCGAAARRQREPKIKLSSFCAFSGL